MPAIIAPEGIAVKGFRRGESRRQDVGQLLHREGADENAFDRIVGRTPCDARGDQDGPGPKTALKVPDSFNTVVVQYQRIMTSNECHTPRTMPAVFSR